MTDVTRDEAMLWLHERVGKSVHVSVLVARGDVSRDVLAAEGELRSWRDVGLFDVGEASVDLTEVGVRAISTSADGGDVLRVQLAEYFWLEVAERCPDALKSWHYRWHYRPAESATSRGVRSQVRPVTAASFSATRIGWCARFCHGCHGCDLVLSPVLSSPPDAPALTGEPV
jgi:hypothetical protein